MEIGGWMEKRDPIHMSALEKTCGVRSTVLLDTSKSSWERSYECTK